MSTDVGQVLARLRRERGLSQAELAGLLAEASGNPAVTRHEVSRHERGARRPTYWLRFYAKVHGVSITELQHGGAGLEDADRTERIRRELTDAITDGVMSAASLDDWEQTVDRHGRATRDHPAATLLTDLGADLTELHRTLARFRSASSLRRLSRVTARMAGLMCQTLCKLDARSALRRWARTARLAAGEAGDPETSSWVLAQEAYGHYYGGDLLSAIDVARQAQDVVRSMPCVGVALATALEARAHAAIGQPQDAHQALVRTEHSLTHLDAADLTSSAFGYTEAQLRFHEGNVHTHLRQVDAALAAQDRALELCSPGDYTDWAMTRFDRALCLALSGTTPEALAYAAETMSSLNDHQRCGIIARRGFDLLAALPQECKRSSAAREFHELLMITKENR